MTLVTEIRRGHLLKYIDLSGVGLEIGPYDQPTILKSEADVRYLDWKNREQLVSECSHSELIPEIPEIDYVVASNNYRDYVEDQFDFIIANHVMEHAPNMIQWLSDISEMMKENAVLFLALPDKEFSFDRYRPDTALSHLVAEFFSGVKEIPVEHHIEVEMYYDLGFINEEMNIVDRLDWSRIQAAISKGPHIGIHSHVFRSSTILSKILKPLLMMGFLPLNVVDFIPARGETGGEMLIVLRKGARDAGVTTQEFYTEDQDETKRFDEELADVTNRLACVVAERDKLNRQIEAITHGADLFDKERGALQRRPAQASAEIEALNRRAEAFAPGAERFEKDREDLRQELVKTSADRDALSLRLEQAHATINALRSSNSWRVTEPLRKAARILRGQSE